jgi:two-component system, chemotaxis family, sensor kinase CheA
MVEHGDKVREDFYSEAQEIIEELSRNLLALDDNVRTGRRDPALVNETFRAVHTLKGLSGLFGAGSMGSLAHHLEDVLDDLRMGKVAIDAPVLDVLFRAVELFSELLVCEKAEREGPLGAVDELLARIRRIGVAPGPTVTGPVDYELDPGMLAVLTEYEEHRLRSNIAEGRRLYRLRVHFDLMTIDRELEGLKESAKDLGEIITYLPTGDNPSPDAIDLDVLMASAEPIETLNLQLGADKVQIEEVSRCGASGARPPTSKPMAPPSQRAAAPAPLVQSPVTPTAEGGTVEAQPGSLRSVSQTVRVDIRRLDHLMNIVGELAIVRGALIKMGERLRREGHRTVATELQRLTRSFDRRLTEMQDGILDVRMVPLSQVFERLARAVRQLSRETKKEIRLVITGSETEIDKLIVEELSDPLMHMIRNAIDHGIESAGDRLTVGKPEAGTIALNAFQKGNHVVLEVEDDGHGVDTEAILARAVKVGRVAPEEAQELTSVEVLSLIFLPGISSRDTAGGLSGRGVGMDVVKNNIARLGGVIDIHSERGTGTKFTITLPITLAIVSALMVRVDCHVFAIPLASVSEAIVFDGSLVHSIDGREVISLRGTTLPICRLDGFLGLPRGPQPIRRQFAVVACLGSRRLGLVVDELIGQQDIVIKALGRSLATVRGFSGATELGDQRVGLVLDAASIIEEVLRTGDSGLREGRVSRG